MNNSQPMLGFVLHEVARLLRRRFEQHARDLGLTRSQWQALYFLAPNEGIHQGKLAELLDVEPITLGRILDKLENRKLIERRAHPTDRRVRLLYLTDAAHPLLARMRELGNLTRSEALSGIPDAERERLLQTLVGMKKNLLDACDRPAAAVKDANYA